MTDKILAKAYENINQVLEYCDTGARPRIGLEYDMMIKAMAMDQDYLRALFEPCDEMKELENKVDVTCIKWNVPRERQVEMHAALAAVQRKISVLQSKAEFMDDIRVVAHKDDKPLAQLLSSLRDAADKCHEWNEQGAEELIRSLIKAHEGDEPERVSCTRCKGFLHDDCTLPGCPAKDK
jgi:hypothetical protein